MSILFRLLVKLILFTLTELQHFKQQIRIDIQNLMFQRFNLIIL